ncbi:MAG: class I SAM-dependent methyltransferase [Gammaproteobacteria bacterium]|jgi:ubiquinone/menaquinone biosynthesis C-methylase UbiE
MRTFIPDRTVTPSSEIWEDAYRRFETPEEEINKFIGRLHKLGAENWPRSARLAELFCGRGNGLHALAKLGFTHIEGIDLSRRLATLYEGGAWVTVGDCRALPWQDASKDVLIVQGGLHHLLDLEHDLMQVLSEANRVLVDGGRFVAVEPWLTPFLQVAHAASFSPLRRISGKIDALATMIEHERESYERWLTAPDLISLMLTEYFRDVHISFSFGKMYFIGVRK